MAVLMSPVHLFPLIFKQFAVQGVNSEFYKLNAYFGNKLDETIIAL